MDKVTITLPKYAVRYLQDMCKRDRELLLTLQETTFSPISLGMQASFDSLNAIECALPNVE